MTFFNFLHLKSTNLIETMRTIIILAFVLMQFVAMAVDVPPTVEQNFKSKYPTATDVEWYDEDGGNFAAYFMVNDQSKTAIFGANGAWSETKTFIDESELPAILSKAVKSKYANAEITGVTMIELPQAPNQFEISAMANDTNYLLTYDEKGQLLKTLEEVSEDEDDAATSDDDIDDSDDEDE